MEEDERLKAFGEKVKQLRVSKGLTQLELADKIGSGESTISRVEKGKYNPSLKWLLRFAEALETSAPEMMEYLRQQN